MFRLGARDTDPALPQPQPIGGLFHLLFAMLDTARNARDNAQMQMASYRERVAHVYLKQDEGGLNLDMAPETLVALGKKGEGAADTFLAGDGRPGFDFEEHRWVRLLLLMNHLERELFAAGKVTGPHPATVEEMVKNIKDLFEKQRAQDWYRPLKKEASFNEAERRVKALFEMVDTWARRPPAPAAGVASPGEVAAFREPDRSPGAPAKGAVFFQHEPPIPSGTLRVTSEV
ncbi:MAG: hypothetical protein QM820_22375 [Minicystis sp.]